MGVQVSGFGVQPNNRAILLTPPGAAAIAVVRLVGDGAATFLKSHFDQPVAEGRAAHGTLRDGARVLDDPVVVVSARGRVADLNLHGGPWVVRSVMELARREGFAVDEAPGLPLPFEAVDAETELGREILQFLPMGTTELAVRTLLAQQVAWEKWVSGKPSVAEIQQVLIDCGLDWLLRPPRVSIIGVPNVGKSTLANHLFARERAITADAPGTTRDWVGEIANVDGLAVMLVDTPGLRDTADAIEREAIERSREQVTGADLVLLVLDPTQPREPEQAALEREYSQALLFINKSDRAPLWEAGGAILRTVATTGAGVEALRDAIRRRFLGNERFEVNRPRCWTARQREMLRAMLVSA
jgi:small GTP-binding protein